jgi:hypothetical protein
MGKPRLHGTLVATHVAEAGRALSAFTPTFASSIAISLARASRWSTISR